MGLTGRSHKIDAVLTSLVLRKLVRNPGYAKAVEWGRLLTVTGGTQVVVQAIGLLCGLLVVRLLPTQEYAFYTIANTMLGTMTIMADSGIGRGVMAIGGQVWQDKKQLGDVVATGFAMRQRFALVSLLVATPILIYLLIHQKASWLTSVLIILSVIPAFVSALSDTLLEVTPKLHQAIYPLQKNQLQVSLLRLVLTSLGVFIFPFAAAAILCSGIPRAYGNLKLKAIAARFTEGGRHNKTVQVEITKTVKRVMPGAVFYCFTGQITIWIISLSGNATAVAEVGALGRITAVFALFTMIFNTLVIPRYARLKSFRELLVTSYFQVLIGTVAIFSLVCGIVFFFSHQFLMLIGRNYYGLDNELFLYVLTTCVGLLSSIHVSLLASRGWIIRPAINIPFELLVLVSGIFIFNMSSLTGVIHYNLYLYNAYLVQYIIYFIYCIRTKTQVSPGRSSAGEEDYLRKN